jgi:peptide/nickel transport system substrate-binding protein
MIFIFIILASCLAGAEEKSLSIAVNAEYETLNPIVNSMMAAIYIQDAALRPLVVLTPEGKAKPLLLKKMPTYKNKKAELEFSAKAFWGDGTPVTCEDLKASWQIGGHVNVSTPNREDYLNIENIEINEQNRKKCSVTFKEDKWNFYLSFPRPMPAHLELKIFEQFKDQAQAYERNSLYVRQPNNPGLYNGPFRVSEVKQGNYIALVRNQHFHGRTPYFDKIVIKFILNTGTMEANLRSGTVQLASSSGFTFDQALAFEKKIKAEDLPYKVIFVPGTMYQYVGFNLDHPVLKDGRVRQAFAYATNRQELTKAFFENRQKPALHFSTELDSYYTADPRHITTYSYDKKKAQKLLDQAGWKIGADGIRFKDGKRLSLTISGATDNKMIETIEVFLQSAWKSIGIDLQIKNYPARVLFSEILRKRKFELSFASWVSSPDASMKSVLHSAMIPSEKNSWSGVNRAGWINKDVDRWLDAYEQEFDHKKRISLMRKVLKAYSQELPALALYYRANNSVYPKDLKGYRISGHNFTEFLEIENWRY